VLTAHFPAIEMLLALPEHQVFLPGGSRPSQNDIWVLARSAGQLISIAVEGKVSEPFGPTVQEWRAKASPGKSERLNFLCGQLGIQSAVPDSLRYQLLHRAASAVIEATRFGAAHALMLVHSFSQSSERFQDYAAFVALLGGNEPQENSLVSVGARSGIQLHLGWVRGDSRYLSK